MLKLKNVSKFYYNKGVIASGFTKANIEFNIGEFVVITGESGSGKSTLLNVISGLDSYEEGEMYINGLETSHYRESDFEEYRKKYVSNIFQAFNLVNSYTVYQNVELVLLLNGYKKKEVKQKILDIIEEVKLSKYKNTKVSKLSGGQKQRVAIARALAKETPIIVCDEPTGNLDSKSAKEVIRILKEISKDKLVIMVTHNFPEVQDVATRVVQMHDGKIISDKRVIKTELIDKLEVSNENKNMGIINVIRLGLRNTFNIIPKFLLILIVFLFITASLLTVYASFKKSEYESSKVGENYYFSDTSDTRIVIKKKDGSAISKSDIEEINKLDHVVSFTEYDIMQDKSTWFEDDGHSYSIYGYVKDINLFNYKLDFGRMPDEDNEIVVLVSEDDYYFNHYLEDIMKTNFYYIGNLNYTGLKVVGIKKYSYGEMNGYDSYIYGSDKLLKEIMNATNKEYSNGKLFVNNKNYELSNYIGGDFNIEPSDKVAKGNMYAPEDKSYICKNYSCKNNVVSLSINNLYFSDKVDFKINNVYTNKNVNNLLGFNKDDEKYGSFFINTEDYNNLFNKESYQSSVFADKADNVDSLDKKLNDLGYITLQIRKTIDNSGSDVAKVLKIVKLIVLVALVFTLFFVSYFVIKLILKSRNVYFSTLRILGAYYSQIKRILDIELFVNSTIAYIFFVGFLMLNKFNIVNIKFFMNIVEFLKFSDYIIMYIILVVMSYLISSRFAIKIFKKSAMKTYREEV